MCCKRNVYGEDVLAGAYAGYTDGASVPPAALATTTAVAMDTKVVAAGATEGPGRRVPPRPGVDETLRDVRTSP